MEIQLLTLGHRSRPRQRLDRREDTFHGEGHFSSENRLHAMELPDENSIDCDGLFFFFFVMQRCGQIASCACASFEYFCAPPYRVEKKSSLDISAKPNVLRDFFIYIRGFSLAHRDFESMDIKTVASGFRRR